MGLHAKAQRWQRRKDEGPQTFLVFFASLPPLRLGAKLPIIAFTSWVRSRQHNQMRFVKESLIRASPERVFAFHEQPEALVLLLPPWESARVIQSAKISEVGARAIVETRLVGPITVQWIAEHTVYDPPHMFEDIQIKGPFRRWRHRHLVEPHKDGATLRDEIDYEPPLGLVGRAFAPLLIESRLRKLFDYRHQVTRRWCEEPGR